VSTRAHVSIALAGLVACGPGKAPEAPVAEHEPPTPAVEHEQAPPAPTPEAAPEDRSAEHVPTHCAGSGPICSPDPKFVKRLCNGKYSSVGLYLFSNPAWTRGYLTRRTQAWNASGGASDSGWVDFDEEVLILYTRRADAGGMQVSGAGGGYDALRWDGSCVTLQSEEVTLQKPPSPKNPPIDFRYLDDETQQALRKDDKLNKAWQARRKECKGATSGEVSLACVKADEALTRSVVNYIRQGGSVPEPTKLP